MSYGNASKVVVAIAPTSTTNAATATGSIDTKGFDFLTLNVHTSTSDSTSNNPSVLKIEEGDTTASYAAITALTGDGEGGFTIPAAVTSGNWVQKFNIDLRGRKRYLKLSVSPTTTQTITAIGDMFYGDDAPTSAGDAGANGLVEV